MNIRDIPVRAMSLNEAQEIIAKMGGRDEYLRQVRADRPIEPPAKVSKSAAEIAADYYEALAKALGISLEQLFQENPAAYRRYQKVASGRNY